MKELSLFSAALNRQNLKAVIFSSGQLLHPPNPVLPICLRIARARPTKVLKATTFPKNISGFNPHKLVSNLESRISALRPVLFYYGLFKFLLKGKLPGQSLVSSLIPNILILFTMYLTFVYVRFRIPTVILVIYIY